MCYDDSNFGMGGVKEGETGLKVASRGARRERAREERQMGGGVELKRTK